MQKKGKNGRMVGEEREGKSRMETGGRKDDGEADPRKHNGRLYWLSF